MRWDNSWRKALALFKIGKTGAAAGVWAARAFAATEITLQQKLLEYKTESSPYPRTVAFSWSDIWWLTSPPRTFIEECGRRSHRHGSPIPTKYLWHKWKLVAYLLRTPLARWNYLPRYWFAVIELLVVAMLAAGTPISFRLWRLSHLFSTHYKIRWLID